MGIDVHIHETSSLLKDPLYGFDEIMQARMILAKTWALSQIKK